MLPYRATKLPITDVTVEGISTQQNLEAKRVQNAMNLAGGLRVNGRTVTADGDVSSTDGMLYGDTTSGNVTMNLLLAEEYYGALQGFKQTAGANVFTVAARAGETIIDATGASVASVVVGFAARWFHASDDLQTWCEV